MGLYEQLANRDEKISLIGLGYVGMPIAVAFAKITNVIGFDINKEKIELYKSGIDPTKEVGNEVIKNTSVDFTSDETKLRDAKFHIVAVPTPVKDDHTPDLSPAEEAAALEDSGDYIKNSNVLIDIKGIFNRKEAENAGLSYWRL